MPRRKRRGRRQEEYVLYIVLADAWDYSYGFSAAGGCYESAHLSHTATLTFSGTVAYPEKFAYPRAEVTLSGHADLRPPDDGIRPAIGTIHANADVIRFYVFVPENHMAELVAAASSGRIRQINFTGTPLKWAQGHREQRVSLHRGL